MCRSLAVQFHAFAGHVSICHAILLVFDHDESFVNSARLISHDFFCFSCIVVLVVVAVLAYFFVLAAPHAMFVWFWWSWVVCSYEYPSWFWLARRHALIGVFGSTMWLRVAAFLYVGSRFVAFAVFGAIVCRVSVADSRT